MPVTGHSFTAILDDPDAPAANTLQYFENAGSRALIAEIDGVWWKVVTKHNQGGKGLGVQLFRSHEAFDAFVPAVDTTLDAVLDRDYPLLQGAVFTIATLLAFVNLGTDLLYFFIDPRIEYA